MSNMVRVVKQSPAGAAALQRRPAPGELTLIQLDLPPGLLARLGEAAIIVGPTGSITLLDVSHNHHAPTVREVVRTLNTQWLIPSRGFPSRTPLQVEWVVLTHFHADHAGAFAALTAGADALEIVRGVVHRGFTDLGPSLNEAVFEQVCEALQGPFGSARCAALRARIRTRLRGLGAQPAHGLAGRFTARGPNPLRSQAYSSIRARR